MLAEAIVGHMIGDYVLQNDYLANNKKQSSSVCFVHALLWTLSVCVCTWCWNGWFALWLFATHFIIDRTNFIAWWMDNVSGQGGFKKHLGPWSVIAVDNTFHLITLIIAVKSISLVQ
jgi:hypothetical protein